MISARRGALAALFATFFIAGCAHPMRAGVPNDPKTGPWAGRLALQVQDQPGHSFSAGFELRGRADAGELTLLNPLGGVVAQLSWAPGSATLQSGGQTRQYQSVDALVAAATGSSIPVAALFDWLAGVNTPVPGWQPDLSQLAQGRLRAQRLEPPPVADLRVVLEQ